MWGNAMGGGEPLGTLGLADMSDAFPSWMMEYYGWT